MCVLCMSVSMFVCLCIYVSSPLVIGAGAVVKSTKISGIDLFEFFKVLPQQSTMCLVIENIHKEHTNSKT